MLTVVNEDGATPSGGSLLDEIVREGSRRMLAVRAGARFERGLLVERAEGVAA